MRICAGMIAMLMLVELASAQTTRPTTQPMPADQLLNQMLQPSGGPRPLRPIPNAPATDATTGGAAVAPGAASMSVLREGTFLVDRSGRLSRAADGQTWEFTLEADGRAMKDPPLVILPNLKLMAMEQAVKNANRDLRFRITGMITEYGGRNYILLEKVVFLTEANNQL